MLLGVRRRREIPLEQLVENAAAPDDVLQKQDHAEQWPAA
jgi:hypothetical protein